MLHSLLGFSLLSFSFSFSLSIPLHLLDTLPHQLFSGPDEMTPEGNLILIVCACPFCVCGLACMDTENAYVLVSLVSYFASSAHSLLPTPVITFKITFFFFLWSLHNPSKPLKRISLNYSKYSVKCHNIKMLSYFSTFLPKK